MQRGDPRPLLVTLFRRSQSMKLTGSAGDFMQTNPDKSCL